VGHCSGSESAEAKAGFVFSAGGIRVGDYSVYYDRSVKSLNEPIELGIGESFARNGGGEIFLSSRERRSSNLRFPSGTQLRRRLFSDVHRGEHPDIGSWRSSVVSVVPIPSHSLISN